MSRYLFLFWGLLLLTWGHAPAAEGKPDHNQVLSLQPITMAIIGGAGNADVISLGYERRLAKGPWSFQASAHGGYNRNGRNSSPYGDEDYALGAGLGIRRYIGSSFDGAYITFQSDFVRGKESSWYEEFPDTIRTLTDKTFLSMTQISCGYKVQWDYVVFDFSVGGALYVTDGDFYTLPIVGASVGVPFGSLFSNFGGRP